jgi:hypothetical protein
VSDGRTGRNIQHDMTNLLRQSVYSRLAGYEDVNDAQRLSVDYVMRAVTGKKKNAASINTIGRFETETLALKENLESLSEINGRWVEKAMNIRLNSDSLVLNIRINPSILQNNVLGMNYKPRESRIYSFIVLIWGIFISVQMRT